MSRLTAGRSRLLEAWWHHPPAAWTRALLPLAWTYDALRRLHRLPWRLGLRVAPATQVPVIVVGNVVVGGVGKTPTVLALARALQDRGYHPGIVSRGHGASRGRGQGPKAVTTDASADEVGDEPLLLARRTGAPVWVGRDRAQAVRALCEAHPAVDVVISDDGLQHHGLARAAQLIVFDARGVGNGRLLPAGPLREPLAASVPPRSVVLYHADQPSTPWPGCCAPRRLGAILPLKTWWLRQGHTARQGDGPSDDSTAAEPAAGDPVAADPAAGDAPTIESMRHRRWRAAAGIGNPEAFFRMLEAQGLSIERWPLPDHAALDPRPWPDDAMPLLVTEKDAVKLPPTSPDAERIHVATLDFELPGACVEALLELLSTGTRSR